MFEWFLVKLLYLFTYGNSSTAKALFQYIKLASSAFLDFQAWKYQVKYTPTIGSKLDNLPQEIKGMGRARP